MTLYGTSFLFADAVALVSLLAATVLLTAPVNFDDLPLYTFFIK